MIAVFRSRLHILISSPSWRETRWSRKSKSLTLPLCYSLLSRTRQSRSHTFVSNSPSHKPRLSDPSPPFASLRTRLIRPTPAHRIMCSLNPTTGKPFTYPTTASSPQASLRRIASAAPSTPGAMYLSNSWARVLDRSRDCHRRRNGCRELVVRAWLVLRVCWRRRAGRRLKWTRELMEINCL